MADRTEKILLQLELNVEQLLTNLQRTTDSMELLKKQQASVKFDLKELEKQGVTSGSTYDNLQKKLIGYNAELKRVGQEHRNYEKQLILSAQANKAAEGSYEQLLRQYQLANIELKNQEGLLTTNDKGVIVLSDTYKEAAEKVTQAKDAIIQFDQGIKDGRTNVGNYASGFQTFREEIKAATDELKNSIDTFGAQSQEAVTAKQKLSDLKDAQKDLNKELEAFQPEGKIAAFAKLGSSLAGGIAAAQGAMGLFGDQSEDVGRVLIKIQGTIAVMQGLKAFSELGKDLKIVLPLLGQTAATTTSVAVAQTGVATTAVPAAAGARAVGTAFNSMLGPLGLALAGILLAVSAFSAFGESSTKKIEKLTASLESENEAHKKTLQTLQEKSSLTITTAESELAIANARKASAEEIGALEKKLNDAKGVALQKEKTEISTHLEELERAYVASSQIIVQAKNEEALKKARENQKSIEDEIAASKNRSTEIIKEEKKLQAELTLIEFESEEKRKQEQNQIASLRIGTIRNDHQREIAQIKQDGQEKLDAIKDDEANAAEKRILISQDTERRIAESEREFRLKSLQERNQLTIALTREGTLERVDAEIKAAQTERVELLKNTQLTETQRQLIIADTNNKVRELEDQRLQIIEQHNQQEIELENRKAAAKIASEKASAGTDLTKQLAARLNEITIGAQAAVDAKEREADELKAAAQREITDHEQLQQRIKDIDETIAAEKLAIVQQSAFDVDQATRESNESRIQNILNQKQLEIEASDPEGTLDLQKEYLQLQEQQEIASAEKSGRSVELIKRKYAKLQNQIDKERESASLAVTADALGALGGLFKKGSNEAKAFSTAQALIDTYLGAQRAYTSQLIPGDPTSLARAIGAAVAATIKGLANVAAIQGVQFYEGGYDTPSGYTGDGVPTDVSRSHSTPRRTVHKQEYIIPHKILGMPHVSSFVRNFIEPIRVRTNGVNLSSSFAGGGFADAATIISAQAAGIDMDSLKSVFMEAIAEATPRQVLVIEEATAMQEQIVKVESRANI